MLSNSKSKHTFQGKPTHAHNIIINWCHLHTFDTSRQLFLHRLGTAELTNLDHFRFELETTSLKTWSHFHPTTKFMRDSSGILRCVSGPVMASVLLPWSSCYRFWLPTISEHEPPRWLVDKTYEPGYVEYMHVCMCAKDAATIFHGRYYLLSFRRIVFFWIMLYAGAGCGLDRSGSSPLCSRFMCCKHHTHTPLSWNVKTVTFYQMAL